MSQPIADAIVIAGLLPHRHPFLFVDQVLELEVDQRILACRTLLEDEPHFKGHFPGRPIMPGVLIQEALAQTSGLLLALSAQHKGEAAQGRLFYLARAEMKWTEPALPGDTLFLEARLEKQLDLLRAFKVSAFTKRNKIAIGSLTLAQVKEN